MLTKDITSFTALFPPCKSVRASTRHKLRERSWSAPGSSWASGVYEPLHFYFIEFSNLGIVHRLIAMQYRWQVCLLIHILTRKKCDFDWFSISSLTDSVGGDEEQMLLSPLRTV